MFDTRLDRRELLQRGALLGLASAIPGWAFARTGAGVWPQVQAMLDRYVVERKLAGVVASVGRGTEPADFLASGTLARDSTRPVDADSLFRVYSMTKPLTGMCAMMLVEDGKLTLDQDIGDFIPGFRNPRVLIDGTKNLDARPATRPVTVRNLMTHSAGLGYAIISKGPLLAAYLKLGLTSGVASRLDLPGFANVKPAPSLAAFADRIATLPLIADPGTRWSYSAGLDVLGRVIEVASGMSFPDFMMKRLFVPLGMTSSFFRVPEGEKRRLTTNYGILGTTQIPIDPAATTVFADDNVPLGGASLVMSARDYDRFLQMLAGCGAVGRTRVMEEATARLGMSNLLPPGTSTAGTPVAGQGFGAGGRVTIALDPLAPAGIGTFGWGGAAATIAFVDPTRGVRAGGFAQYMPSDVMPFTRDFGKAVYSSL